MSHLQPTIATHTIAFFIPEFRKHDLIHSTFILNVAFNAFDHFKVEFSLRQVPLSILLQLPLKYLLLNIPNGHWVHRHPDRLASFFFVWDRELSRLRFKILEHEIRDAPVLIPKLSVDILIRHTVQLQPFLWQYITPNPGSMDNTTDYSLQRQFVQHPLWNKFSTSNFRMLNYEEAFSRRSNISYARIKRFWSISMLLPARNLWYRVFNKKVPHRKFMLKISKEVTSSDCPLCGHQSEDFKHFVLTCPIKIDIWNSLLIYWYPYLEFTTEQIRSILTDLRFSTINVPQQNQFITRISTAQFKIWSHYWSFVIQRIPFQPDAVIKSTIREAAMI